MHLTFLEAANGISLSKQHTKTQFISYPHVKKLTSHLESSLATIVSMSEDDTTDIMNRLGW